MPVLNLFIIFIITASLFVSSSGMDPLSPVLSQEQKPNQQEITLTAMLDDQGDPPRLLKMLFEPALKELQSKHPELNIKLDYRPIPYLDLHPSFLQSMANDTTVDIMTVDYIWLGEFVERGLLTDITNYTKSLGRASEWYQSNWDGGSYKDKIYGVWTVADARGIWYWKDLSQQAGVNSTSLNTWNGYIEAAKKLNQNLRPQGIEGVHLVGAGHSPDIEFFPYLWMLGGAIIENRPGHPTKGLYWFPGYNSSEGVRALEFVRDQITAGSNPKRNIFGEKNSLIESLRL